MILKLMPQGGWAESTSITLIDENCIVIDNEPYTIDPSLVCIDPVGPVLAGERGVDGELTLTVLVKYADADRAKWEVRGADGKYRGEELEVWLPGDTL